MQEIITKALQNYNFFTPITSITPLSGGNVNKTYKLTDAVGVCYVLQQINTDVFHRPEEVMQNVMQINNRLQEVKKQKSLDKTCVLNIKFTRDNLPVCYVGERCFRIYYFVNHARCVTVPQSLLQILSGATAFGNFFYALNCGKKILLYDTIKDFHSPLKRFDSLLSAYQKAPKSRKNKAKRYFRRLKRMRRRIGKIERALIRLPLRAVHNDVKCANVAFDEVTGEAIGVLDLDTAMYGCVINDFGDGARSFCCSCDEDESDLKKVSFDLNKYYYFCKGFLKNAGKVLTHEELNILPHGAFYISFELATRFLTDYLLGDVYFAVSYKEHNLVRARCITTLCQDILSKRRKISKTAQNAR